MAATWSAAISARAKQTSQESQAKPPLSLDGLDPETQAIMRKQEELEPAAKILYEAYLRSPESGFASAAFEDDGVTLYWKGPLTPEMSVAISAARAIGPVRLKEAAFSMAEMEAAAMKIDGTITARGASEIQAVVAKHDGSGLEVERIPDEVAAKLTKARITAGKGALLSADQILSGLDLRVPVRVTTASEAIEPMIDRFNDTSPWNSGGYYESRRGPNLSDLRGRCSTGFGIRAYGRTWVLTAAHCATAPDIAKHGCGSDIYDQFDAGRPTPDSFCGNRPTMGPVTREHYDYDLILIDAQGFYRMFDGPRDNGGYYKNVLGWGYHHPGQLLCQSGVRSGAVCNITTGDSVPFIRWSPDHPDSDGDSGYRVYGLISSTKSDGIAVRGGDSGGPVFTLQGSGVTAKGSVSASSNGGRTMYFQDWADVRRLYDNAVPVCPPGSSCAQVD